MKRKPHFLLLAFLSVCLLSVPIGCDREEAQNEQVLRVGVIASLSGPARPWGLVSVRCAQVIADYHNERGGVQIGDERVRIELVVRDDGFNSWKAVSIAHELSMDGVKYVIGPLGDGPADAAAGVLDSAGALYVHYGFNQLTQSPDSLGLLGMPLPRQSLPLLFRHLRNEQDVGNVLVMAYGTDQGIRQKKTAERLAIEGGLELVRLARFDVSEETFNVSLNLETIQRRVERVVEAGPDSLIVAGCPPEAFVVLLEHLRSGGYEGFIGTQNYQDADLLASLGDASDLVYYVGGAPTDDLRSAYYEDLKARYLTLADTWSGEADTKLYALETILACLRAAGQEALERTSAIRDIVPNFRFEDPFYAQSRQVSIIGGSGDGRLRQIQTPIRISKMSEGRSLLVKETLLETPPVYENFN